MTYKIINVKESHLNDADNVSILCATDEKSKYLIAGDPTASLKMKRDDFNYVIRAHGYSLDSLSGKILVPKFGRYDYLDDFDLCDPESGEVL